MHAFDRVRVSVATAFSRAGRLHGLAAAAALLTCAAVVLNIGPFAPAPNTDGARNAVRSAIPTVIARSEEARTVALQVAESPSPLAIAAPAVTPDTSSEPGEAVIRTSALSVVEIAEAAPAPPSPVRAEPAPKDAIVGVWAPDAGTCSARNFRDGDLPTVINADGAWAGDTFCMFSKKEKTDTGWKVLAKCSNPRETWTSQVRLTVSDNRLRWVSKRGTQAYTRCEADVLMARAN